MNISRFYLQVDKDAAKKTAEEILSQPEYQPEEEVDFPEINPDLTVSNGVGIGTGLIQILLIFSIVAILAFFIWYFRDALFARNTRKKKNKETTSIEEIEKHYTKRDVWLQKAEEAERDKKYDQAVHCRYMALVSGLAEKDKVPLSDSLTCGEYSDLLPEQIAAAEFTDVRSTFENSRYGGVKASGNDTQSLQSLDSTILGTIDNFDQSNVSSVEVDQ